MAQLNYSTATAFLFSLVGNLLVWLVKQLAKLIAKLVVVAVCHPRTSTALAVLSTLVLYVGWVAVVTVAGAALVLASTWKAAHAPSFEATVQTWVRTWWRRWWAYRRQWIEVFTRCELSVAYGEANHVPKLVKVSTTAYWDRLVVKAQAGQELQQFRDAAEKLRGSFGAERADVRELAPLTYGLNFMRRDPLLETVPATPIPDSLDGVDFRAVPIGRTEFEEPYTLSLLGGHTSGAGSTGAGKAGVEWNVLRGIAPAIAAGLVRLVGIDPKGIELRRGSPLFADGDYVGADENGVVALLQRLVGEMNEANEAAGQSGERDFEPRPGRPLTLIMIDEGAPLLRYWSRTARGKIEDALGLLLTQGRAAGFHILFLVQEPTKDTFTLRDLFTRRIALRLPTESHTDASLVEKAVDFGARCHEVSETTPGVFFSLEDGARSTIRARLGYVRDEDIDELVEYVTARRNVVQLDSRRPADPDSKAA